LSPPEKEEVAAPVTVKLAVERLVAKSPWTRVEVPETLTTKLFKVAPRAERPPARTVEVPVLAK
jgi:hypothetical protein